MKTLTAEKKLKDVYKDITNWCNLQEVFLSKSEINQDNFVILGKKKYKSKLNFRWGLAIGLFLLGVIVAAGGTTGSGEGSVMFTSFLFVGIYVVYYFINSRDKSVTFVFKGVTNSENNTDLQYELSRDAGADASNQVIQLMNKFI